MKEYKLFVNGQWVDAKSKETFEDLNPYTGKLYAKIAKAGEEDVDAVMAAAFDARAVWANTPAPDRFEVLAKAAQLMREQRQDFVDILIDEGGGTIGKAEFEVGNTINVLQYAAEDCKRIYGEVFHNYPGKVSMSSRQPKGTIVAIAPWNFPMVLSMYKIAYGLATGNTVVFKPASETPVAGLRYAGLFKEAGVPDGAFNVITGPGSVIGDALITDPRCSFVTITGETETGRHIATQCAQNLKEYTLELGGKNPLIILKDADLDYAVQTAAFHAFLHQGEICMSVDKVIVEEEIADVFTEKLVNFVTNLQAGDPRDPKTFIGPVISDKQVKDIDAHVKDAVEKGAKLLCGGTYKDRIYQATILTDVTPEMRIYNEETFGPVTSIYTAKDEKDAVRIANDIRYGLSSGVVTNDMERAIWVAEHIEAGMVHINDGAVDANEAVPFGGVKGSGIGREGGQYSIEAFTDTKWITVTKNTHPYF